jgi:hypothetical protein
VAVGARRGFIARRSRQAPAFAVAGALHALIVLAVIWAGYGFRYAAFAQAQPGRDRLVDRWELLMGQPDPLTLLDQLKLHSAQQAVVAKMLREPGLDSGRWTPERLGALDVIRRDVLTPGQLRTLDAMRSAPPPSYLARIADFFRRHRLLPEAFLYGQAHTLRFSGQRTSFLNGEVSLDGWRAFFPYAFLVKTPLPVFGVIGVALAAAVAARRKAGTPPIGSDSRAEGPGFYGTLPLWTLLGNYWIAMLLGHLNIGHRHLMPTDAPLFVLGGAAAYWLQGLPGFGATSRLAAGTAIGRAAGWVLGGLIGALAAEAVWFFPNCLAYFNAIAGGPARGYRHLVDSSLDWGQDLPGVKRYLEQHRPAGPVYLSYFGNASPNYHLPSAAHVGYLFSHPGQDVTPPARLVEVPLGQADAALNDLLRQQPDYEIAGSGPEAGDRLGVMLLKKPAALRLTGGTYLISATMLQPVMYDLKGPVGPWNRRYEAVYQELSSVVKPLLSDDPDVRMAGLKKHRPLEWQMTLTFFEMTRFARLAAFLRQREPDDHVNYSILVYRLSDADVARALEGPPPEVGRDIVAESLQAEN